MTFINCKGYTKKNYPIYLSSNEEFEDLFELLPHTQNCFVVIDEKIVKLFPNLIKQFKQRNAHIFPIHCSEQNKTLDGLLDIVQRVFSCKPSRDDILVAVGGGLVTNLGGLASALIMRGIRSYFVPTTLTGQIDASLGSKQAVNYRGAKNWLGTYSDPEFCYVNTVFLRTKPVRDINSEAIEGVKLCLATNESLFYETFDSLGDLCRAPSQVLHSFIEKMIRVKVAVVNEDLVEENYGMSMLYGHTLGHAIEMLAPEVINHGEAVGLGMLAAARISYMLGLAKKDFVTLHQEILCRLNLPTVIPKRLNSSDIFGKLSYNKKNYGGKVRFILLRNVGDIAKNDGHYFTVVPDDIIMKSIMKGY